MDGVPALFPGRAAWRILLRTRAYNQILFTDAGQDSHRNRCCQSAGAAHSAQKFSQTRGLRSSCMARPGDIGTHRRPALLCAVRHQPFVASMVFESESRRGSIPFLFAFQRGIDAGIAELSGTRRAFPGQQAPSSRMVHCLRHRRHALCGNRSTGCVHASG